MTKEENNIAAIGVFFILLLIVAGISGVTDMVGRVRQNVIVIFKSLDNAIKPLNNGMGLLPTALAGYVSFGIVGYIISGMKLGNTTKSIIGKACYKVVNDIITPVLNWINGIVFK